MNNRQIKISISLAFSIYMALVVFNNVTDYNSNFLFISKVSAMEDVFSKEQTGWRAVNSDLLHHIMYITVILVEAVITTLLFLGTWKLYKTNSPKLTKTALTLGFLLFFIVFLCVAGEWFLMWQSTKWNAQGTAFALSSLFLLSLIFLSSSNDQ